MSVRDDFLSSLHQIHLGALSKVSVFFDDKAAPQKAGKKDQTPVEAEIGGFVDKVVPCRAKDDSVDSSEAIMLEVAQDI